MIPNYAIMTKPYLKVTSVHGYTILVYVLYILLYSTINSFHFTIILDYSKRIALYNEMI